MPAFKGPSNVLSSTNISCRHPERPKDTSQVGGHCPLYLFREGWSCRAEMGTKGNLEVGTAIGGRGGPTGLDFLSRNCFAFSSTWFPAGSPGPPLRRLLTNETVKAQVGHQANNKHSCVARLLSLFNRSSLHVSGLPIPAPISPPVSTTMPLRNDLTLMNLIFNFPAWPWSSAS